MSDNQFLREVSFARYIYALIVLYLAYIQVTHVFGVLQKRLLAGLENQTESWVPLSFSLFFASFFVYFSYTLFRNKYKFEFVIATIVMTLFGALAGGLDKIIYWAILSGGALFLLHK